MKGFSFLCLLLISSFLVGAERRFVIDSAKVLSREATELSNSYFERISKLYNFRTLVFFTNEAPDDPSEVGQNLWFSRVIKKFERYDLYLVFSTKNLGVYYDLDKKANALFDTKDLNKLLHLFEEMHVRGKRERAILQGARQIEATLGYNLQKIAEQNVQTRLEARGLKVTALGVWIGFGLGLLFSFLVLYLCDPIFRWVNSFSWIRSLLSMDIISRKSASKTGTS